MLATFRIATNREMSILTKDPNGNRCHESIQDEKDSESCRPIWPSRFTSSGNVKAVLMFDRIISDEIRLVPMYYSTGRKDIAC